MSISRPPSRIQSAAFIRRQHFSQTLPNPTIPTSSLSHYRITHLPISESRFTQDGGQICSTTHKKTAPGSRFASGKTSPSITSQIWRHVHTTKSQVRLKSMLSKEEQPVRVNLVQKVDRIKSKHKQHEHNYQQCLALINKKTLLRIGLIKTKGYKDNLHSKIAELLAPFEVMKEQAEERYRARLLRIRKF